MKRLAIAAAALCAGCAVSIGEIRKIGERSDYVITARGPADAAACIASSTEGFKPYIADRFPPRQTGDTEVVVRHPALRGLVAVFDIATERQGSKITAWRNPRGSYPELAQRIVEACGAQRVETPWEPKPAPQRPRSGV